MVYDAARPSSSAPVTAMWAPPGRRAAADVSDDESEASVCSFSGASEAVVAPDAFVGAGLSPADGLALDVDLWPTATEPHVWLPLEHQC